MYTNGRGINALLVHSLEECAPAFFIWKGFAVEMGELWIVKAAADLKVRRKAMLIVIMIYIFHLDLTRETRINSFKFELNPVPSPPSTLVMQHWGMALWNNNGNDVIVFSTVAGWYSNCWSCSQILGRVSVGGEIDDREREWVSLHVVGHLSPFGTSKGCVAASFDSCLALARFLVVGLERIPVRRSMKTLSRRNPCL
jgi:hypothetical protein